MSARMVLFGSILLLGIVACISSHTPHYYVYTTDHDDHCCSVRLGNEFCSAVPLTSRLLLLEKSCPQGKARKKGSTNLKALDKIHQRLKVANTYQAGKKVLLHLETALSKTILKHDQLCLSSESNHINLEKCIVDLGPSLNTSEPHNQLVILEPVAVRPGKGVSIVKRFTLDLTNIQLKTRAQRKCYDWYRSQTKKICSDPCKHTQKCMELTDERQLCLEQLRYWNVTDVDEEDSFQAISVTETAQLICEDDNDVPRALGHYQGSEVCFQPLYEVVVEYKYSDQVYLSDEGQNLDVLQFIANNTELTKEFQTDCNDKTTLANLDQLTEKEHVHDEA